MTALLGAVLLGGCAGSGPTPTPRSDQAAARSINLVASDLPAGFVGSRSSDTSAGPPPAKLAHCAGAPAPVDVAEASSPTFTAAVGQAQEQFSSEVTMLRTATDAGAEMAGLHRPSAVNCLRSELTSALRTTPLEGAAVGDITVVRFSPAGTNPSPVGFHLQIPVSATAARASARVVLSADLICFRVGRAVVTLYARTTGPAGMQAEEARLTGVLARRAGRVPR